MKQICEWRQEEEFGAWETSCDHLFEVTDGTPLENDMVFCPFCGKPLMEINHETTM